MKSIKKLQLVRNIVSRAVLGTPQHVYITLLLGELYWPPTGFQIQFMIMAITFKALDSMKPDLWDCFSLMVFAHPTRPSEVGMLWELIIA